MGISSDGIEGPGALGLNRKVTLTVLLAATVIGLGTAHQNESQVLTVIFVADAIAMVYLMAETALLTRRSRSTSTGAFATRKKEFPDSEPA